MFSNVFGFKESCGHDVNWHSDGLHDCQVHLYKQFCFCFLRHELSSSASILCHGVKKILKMDHIEMKIYVNGTMTM